MVWKIAFLFSLTIAYARERGPQYRGMQVDAMGRSGTASVSGVSALFLNPAGLAGLEGAGLETSGDVGINNELLDYADWVSKNSSALNHFDSLLNSIAAIENKWASISNVYYAQGYYQGIAISVVRDVRYDVSLGKAVILPKLGAGMLSDFQVAAGRGFELSPGWSAGFTLKYIDRQYFEDRLLGENDDQYYTVKTRWQDSSNALLDKLNKIEVASEIAPHEHGVGANFGVTHSLANGFSLGASVLDLPTFLDGEWVYPQLNVGGSYSNDFGALKQEEGWKHPNVLRFNLVINLDWQIPLTRFQAVNNDGELQFPVVSSDQWFKQWKTGLALECWARRRQIGFVSAGLNDGYPVFGARIGYILHAYYLSTAEEMGEYPGQEKRSFQRFGIDVDI